MAKPTKLLRRCQERKRLNRELSNFTPCLFVHVPEATSSLVHIRSPPSYPTQRRISPHNIKSDVIIDAHSKHPWRWPPSTFEAPTSAWREPPTSLRPTFPPPFLRPAVFSTPGPVRRAGQTSSQIAGREPAVAPQAAKAARRKERLRAPLAGWLAWPAGSPAWPGLPGLACLASPPPPASPPDATTGATGKLGIGSQTWPEGGAGNAPKGSFQGRQPVKSASQLR